MLKVIKRDIHVKWSINDECNLRCPFCIAEKPIERQSDLSTQLKMVDKMYEIGVTSIDFFGKEPFFNKRIFEIMDYCKQKHYPFRFSAITNGINLIKYKSDLMLSPLRRVTISHDGFVGNRQRVLTHQEIFDISREFFFVEISLDILKANHKKAYKLVCDFFDEAAVSSVYVKPIIPVGALTTTIKSDYAISEDEYEIVCESLKVLPNVKLAVPFRFARLTKKYQHDFRFSCDPVCTCGDMIFIDSTGVAYGCGEVLYTSRKRSCSFLETPLNEMMDIISTDGKRVCCER